MASLLFAFPFMSQSVLLSLLQLLLLTLQLRVHTHCLGSLAGIIFILGLTKKPFGGLFVIFSMVLKQIHVIFREK